MDEKYLNIKTITSLLLLIAGIVFYIYWGIRYGVWYDIGVYSLSILLVLGGIIGFFLTATKKEETE